MIVAISGRIHSGKDSVGQALVQQLGFKRVAFADGVREFVALMLGESLDYVASDMFKSVTHAVSFPKVCGFMDLPEGRAYQYEHGKLSGRELLQRVGTEAARKVFGDDCWIKVALRKTERHCLGCGKEQRIHFSSGRYENNKLIRNKCAPDSDGPIFHTNAPEHYVITDVRFPNEYEAIKAAGGKVIRLNRADRREVHDFIGGPLHKPTPDICAGVLHSQQPGLLTTVECMLPRSAHPSHYSGDTHPSETSLPDESNESVKYDCVVIGDMAINVTGALASVRAWLGENR